MRQLKTPFLIPGIVAVIGGLLWIYWVMMTASRPLLPPHGYRDSEDIAILQGVSMLFMVVGILGIHVRQRGQSTRLGIIALFTGNIGAILALIGSVMITVYGTNFALVLIFYGGGALLLLLSIILTGISIIGARILPQWSGWLLIGSVILGLTGDENSSNVLVLVGLGVAWVIVGAILSLYPDR